MIDRDFYEAVLRFEESEEAKDVYYRVMDTAVERNGKRYTVREQILQLELTISSLRSRIDDLEEENRRYRQSLEKAASLSEKIINACRGTLSE